MKLINVKRFLGEEKRYGRNLQRFISFRCSNFYDKASSKCE
jgi:hypothetical protein